jgi:glycosyltransferase involved in cell wall biosynthesis
VASDERAPCVCVLGLDDARLTAATVAAVAEVTPPPAELLVVTPPGIELDVARRARIRTASGPGAGAVIAAAVEEAGAADTVLVPAGAVVADGWLARLSHAAQEPLVAMAFALPVLDEATRGAIALPMGMSFAEAAWQVANVSWGEYPRLSTAPGACVYLTRVGLAVTGSPDATLPTWSEVLTDLAQRSIVAGMVNVLAPDVAVRCEQAEQPGPALVGRYPWLAAAHREVDVPASSPTRAVARAQRALGPLTVTLDCRSVGGLRMGTQTHALGLASALAATDGVALRVLIPDGLDSEVAQAFGFGGRTTLLTVEQALRGASATSVVHRPQQVSATEDLALLRPLGERLLITHQDLIGYRNPSYHATADDWIRHRFVTRKALAIADRVLFFSRYALADAVAEDLLDPAWGDVVGLGVDAPLAATAARPPALPDDDGDFLLCLGADLRHKNLPFAIEVLRELRERHAWSGRLVLAGPHLAHGSSAQEEDALLAADDRVRERVWRLGPVSEEEKRWLLERAALVLYPTLDEGFGLLPFEAALAGTPCAHAGTGALAEVLPPDSALLVPWDAAASAGRIAPMLVDPAARERAAATVREAAASATWEAAAARVVAAYECALVEPRRGVTWEARDHALEVEQLRAQVDGLTAFYSAVGEDGARLVGPHPLLDDDERRALLAVAARPALKRPLMTVLRLGYRLGRRNED